MQNVIFVSYKLWLWWTITDQHEIQL
jgi:hypothetical protein